MKTVLLFLAVLFTASTGFARARAILVEVTVQNDGKPTVSIYSELAYEQRLDTSIADAAGVLEKAKQELDTLFISILINGFLPNDSFWELLDGLKKNQGTKLKYLEVAHGPITGPQLQWLAEAKRLQTTFEVPECTKVATHQ